MQLFPKTHFDFLGLRWKFFAVSGILLGGSLISLMTRGVKYGIDFTGGTELQLSFQKPINTSNLRKALAAAGIENPAIQRYVGSNIFMVRVQAAKLASSEELDVKLNSLKNILAQNVLHIDSKSYVGPSVGKHLFQQALWAIILSLAGIIVFLGFRFSNPVWGLAGIIALFHDVLATYGFFSLMGFHIDLLIVSAILTIGGYSIHDTIVIFDRIREKLRVMRKESLRKVMDESMNETLSRTIITSSTVLIVVSILYFFGGKVIHHFALAMVFGTIVGTYSSIAIAAPLVYEWTLRNSAGRQDERPSPVKVEAKYERKIKKASGNA
jgi:preprotein translocase subunit SecF